MAAYQFQSICPEIIYFLDTHYESISRSANQLTIILVSIVSVAIRYTYELMGRWVAHHLAAATDGNGDRVPAGGVP